MIKKRKSFDQRGEMAASAWAEQQMREMNLKARRAARDKVLQHTCTLLSYSIILRVSNTIKSFHTSRASVYLLQLFSKTSLKANG